MKYTITEHFIKYHPEKLIFSNKLSKASINDGIIIKVKLKSMPKNNKNTIFEIPGALKIETGTYHFPEALENLDGTLTLTNN